MTLNQFFKSLGWTVFVCLWCFVGFGAFKIEATPEDIAWCNNAAIFFSIFFTVPGWLRTNGRLALLEVD